MYAIRSYYEEYPHDGKEYHIQVEDLGTDSACLEVRVTTRFGNSASQATVSACNSVGRYSS